jgi:hypothetical protein
MSCRVAVTLAATVAGEVDELLVDGWEEAPEVRATLAVESAVAFPPRAARPGILLAFPPLSMGRLVMVLLVFASGVLMVALDRSNVIASLLLKWKR